MIETTDRFAEHIVNSNYSDLSSSDINKIKTFLLDTFGVGIAGSRGAGVAELIQTSHSWGGGGQAHVWVTGQKVSAHTAAIVNAYQIHCLEFDCVHEGAVVHPMATILSAMIAYCQLKESHSQSITGEEFLIALALGVDVAAFLGMAAEGAINFFRPATAGGLGAVAALAKLERFNKQKVKDALGFMYGQTCGTMQPHKEGSPLLGMQIGFNARGALQAIDLTKAGFKGPHDVIDGKYGYLRLIEKDQFNLDKIWKLMGREWQVSRLSHKPFPSGRLTHGVIDALQQTTSELNITSSEITKVECYVPPLVYNLVGRPNIPSPEPNYAKLCLKFVAGAWLAKKRVSLAEFASVEILSDKDIHSEAKKIEIFKDQNDDLNALDPQKFSIFLSDGTKHEVLLKNMIGHFRKPLTNEQNIEKFFHCLGHSNANFSKQQGHQIMDFIDRIESKVNVAEIVTLLKK